LALLSAGFAIEFIGRFFGFRENPSGIWLEVLPLFATTGAAVIIIFGVFRWMSAWSTHNLKAFRLAMLTILIGASMLICSMLSKSIVPQIFG
jgi:uncharacterized membrane protein YidH (DUF202 family)